MNEQTQPRILLVENIHPVAKELLEAEGYKIDMLSYAPGEEELMKLLPDYCALGIRSKTEVTAKVLEKTGSCFTIGAFCIGTNQIDLSAARKKGVAVFNAISFLVSSILRTILFHW